MAHILITVLWSFNERDSKATNLSILWPLFGTEILQWTCFVTPMYYFRNYKFERLYAKTVQVLHVIISITRPNLHLISAVRWADWVWNQRPQYIGDPSIFIIIGTIDPTLAIHILLLPLVSSLLYQKNNYMNHLILYDEGMTSIPN